MKNLSAILCSLGMLAGGLLPAEATEAANLPPDTPAAGTLAPELAEDSIWTNDSWSAFLPLFSSIATDHGQELPLPIGIGCNFVALRRDIVVTSVKAGINKLHDVSDLVAVDSTTKVRVGIVRADVWLFPFLNLYALAGHLQNETSVKTTFTLPGTGPVELDTTDTLEGTILGGGATLGLGYGPFFLTGDANYTQTEIDGNLLAEKIPVWIYTVRSGWNGRIGKMRVQLWLGAMYWDSEREITGTAGNIRFKVMQGPKTDTNMTLGANLELRKNIHLFSEYAFNLDDLDMLTAGMAFRF